jgi:cytochrome c553
MGDFEGRVMAKILKWTLRSVVGLVALVLVTLAVVWVLSERRMGKVYSIDVAAPTVSADAQAAERGHHIATIRGCTDCHGHDLAGATMIDDFLVGRLSGANLTPGGPVAQMSNADLVRAIRHGVGSNGRPLLFMPAQEFIGLSEQDMSDLLAYLRSVPAVASSPPANRIGPLGRLLFLAGQIPLLPAEIVDHASKPAADSTVGPTVAYGSYLSSSCKGCHGDGFSGGRIPGTPPEWPPAANLTPDPSGLAEWSEGDFRKALREGIARGGRALNTKYMPVAATKHLTDDEISALYAFLRSVPSRAAGQR